MLCKCYWIVLYIVHVTAFCLGGPFFSGHGVQKNLKMCNKLQRELKQYKYKTTKMNTELISMAAVTSGGSTGGQGWPRPLPSMKNVPPNNPPF